MWGAGGGAFSFREASGAASSVTGNQFALITNAAGSTGGLAKSGLKFNTAFTRRKIRPGNRIVVQFTTMRPAACSARGR